MERHHIFSHTHHERMLCEKYGFIAPVRKDLHPNGVHCGKHGKKVDQYLKDKCKEYYLKHYGTIEDFRNDFFYTSGGEN